jgi:hypothetical protein
MNKLQTISILKFKHEETASHSCDDCDLAC